MLLEFLLRSDISYPLKRRPSGTSRGFSVIPVNALASSEDNSLSLSYLSFELIPVASSKPSPDASPLAKRLGSKVPPDTVVGKADGIIASSM